MLHRVQVKPEMSGGGAPWREETLHRVQVKLKMSRGGAP